MFFCPPPSQGGLIASDQQEYMEVLGRAMIVDLAERIAVSSACEVRLYETESDALDIVAPPSTITRIRQRPAELSARIMAASKAVYSVKEESPVAIFVGRNPLYSPAEFGNAMELLHQEDDVVVIAQHGRGLMWFATKSFHPALCEVAGTTGETYQHALMDIPAIVMPVHSLPDIDGMAMIPYLAHEVERRILLRQWFPPRTHECLERMRRAHIFPI